ncbi:MAG: C_GCAxxG_C_C family protein [Firmicutes bacterium]|nr:C_GCAxxG_C_C family protein [Bacillota bacterium]
MTKSEVAEAKFLEGYNCAQAVCYSFGDDLNFDKNLAMKLACGFGAGMGRNEEVCGAVSGGIIVIGMIYGRGEGQDRSLMEQTYEKTRELMKRFKEKQGSFICRELLEGCELTNPEGQNQFKEKDLKNKVCRHCVRNVVEIIEAII